MTIDQFKEKYKFTLGGLALEGATSDTADGPLARTQRAYKIMPFIEKMMNEIFFDLVTLPATVAKDAAAAPPPKQPAAAAPAANGRTAASPPQTAGGQQGRR